MEDRLWNTYFMPFAARPCDNIYVSQSWWRPEKLSRAYNFVRSAKTLGNLTSDHFSIGQQIATHLQGPDQYDEYSLPTVSKFTRLDSSNIPVVCYIIRDGHHRFWQSRHEGINIEFVVNEDFGTLGDVRSINELNKHLYSVSNGELGDFERRVLMNRTVENEIGFIEM